MSEALLDNAGLTPELSTTQTNNGFPEMGESTEESSNSFTDLLGESCSLAKLPS